ncbi:hypothetical protein B0H12DRAFT_1129462 [Mycena haematopus]|nr:hypothetical protein B0H12DRAFT_1129462 [Mycena haematopus]
MRCENAEQRPTINTSVSVAHSFNMVAPATKPSCTLTGHQVTSDWMFISDDRGTARCDTLPKPLPPPTTHIHPGSRNLRRRQAHEAENQRMFSLRAWYIQKHHNPHLSLVLSHFNPLRALLSHVDWKFINTTNRPFGKVGWNFKRPLRSPARLRIRKECDTAGERLSMEDVFSGGLRYHCRVCSKDTLLKRLLLVRHWAAKADAVYKSELSRMHKGDDGETTNNDCPQTVFPRDLDDFEDGDGWPADEGPLIDYHSATQSYPLRLF